MMFHEQVNKEAMRNTIKRKRQREDTEVIKSADISQPAVKRAVLSLLTGKEETKLNLPRGGKSRPAKSRAEVTIAAAANALVDCIAVNDASRAPEIRSLLTKAATKRAPKSSTVDEVPNDVPLSPSTVAAAYTASQQHDNLQKPLTKEQLPFVCGTKLRQQILEKEAGAPRRPYLAALAAFEKPDVQDYLDIKITDKEWKLTRIHARYPGAFNVAPRKETFRCRVPAHILEALLRFLDDSENTQRLAFGQVVRTILKDTQLVKMDNIQLVQTMRKTAVKFVLALMDELESLTPTIEDDVDSEDAEDSDSPIGGRCTKVETDTFRRCQNCADHDGKCRFTTKGTISVSTAKDLVAALTDQEIKSLAGLDDTKTIQGRENFIRMRRLVDDLFGDSFADSDSEEKQRLHDEINAAEDFHKCSFMSHLSRTGTCRCNCLTCGFNDPKNPDDIVCECADAHRPSCVECARAFAVLETLQARVKQLDQPKEDGTMYSIEELELLAEAEHGLHLATIDLREYRSHLARHKAEGEFAADEFAGVQSNQAVVVSDYKMKILACYHRMNQKKWFGQRGISAIGFMIVYTDPDDAATKIVRFILMVTDDTLQDAEQVACAKAYIYSNELPPWITQTLFRSDGAGTYRSQVHRCLQPFWKALTGVTEKALSLDPAGGGKDQLDGTFGRVAAVLRTAVDAGNDLTCKDDILTVYATIGGVTGLKLLGFLPERGKLLDCKLTVSVESILRSELDEETGTIRMYKHSGYGEGVLVEQHDRTFTKKTGDSVLLSRNLVSEIESFLPVADSDSIVELIKQSTVDVSPFGHWTFAVTGLALCDEYKPGCVDIASSSSQKTELQGAGICRPGEGAGCAQQIQAKRAIRKQSKCDAKADSIEAVRQEKENRGVYCCSLKCPTTGRYCTSEFLTIQGRDEHVASGKRCSFPTGMTAKDKLLQLASVPGGALALGTRSNRLEGIVPGRAIVPSSPAAPGVQVANCFQRFNRKEGVPAYRKPDKLVQVLRELFACRPKLDEKQMRIKMKAMRDADGSLMFCWKKRGTPTPAGMKRGSRAWNSWSGCLECDQKPCACNGLLLSEEQIKAWIGQETQRQKKEEAKKRKAAEQSQ